MKCIVNIFVILLLYSCQETVTTNENTDCNQVNYYLQEDSYNDVKFNFNLSPEEQFQHFQSQVNISLCHGYTLLNGMFNIGDSYFETLLITDYLCEDTIHEFVEQPSVLLRTKQILINAKGNILVDGELIKSDSLSESVSKLTRDFFYANEYKIAAFEILWDKATNNKIKFNCFNSIRNGFISSANQIARLEFGKEICHLDSIDVRKLRSKLRFAFVLSRRPNPPLILDMNIIPDTIETELIE